MSLPPGSRLGRYEILGAIGAGGMGEVYRARDPRLDRDVAVKVLPAHFADDPDRVRRFEQEARAVGRLNHPNILAVYDVDRVPDGLPAAGAPFLVSELLEGTTLREEMQGRAMPLRTALTYAREIAGGLAAAHEKGVAHRDLKPENVFVTREGRIKILDFGLAKLRQNDDAVKTMTAANATGPGVVMGTAGYMSPEQIRGQDADHRSDLFSFGVLLYEMLTGRRAFQGATGAEAMSAILHLEPSPMSSASGAQVPGALERIIRRCLEKSPDRRYQSTRDLAFNIETLAEEPETAPAFAAPRSAPPAWLRPTAAIAAIAAVLVGGWFVWSSVSGTRPSSSPTQPPSVNPFLVGPAVETLPAWSPTGNLVAYVSNAAGNDDVWMSDATGTNPINLTKNHAGVDTFPAWAPDGQRLAFYSDREGGGIYTMTALGANVRRVVSVRSSVVYTFSLQWVKDGSIVYTNFADDGTKQIYRVSPSDASPVCLTCGHAPATGARAGALSPSTRLLAYVGSIMGPRPPLFVLDLSSGRATELADRADAPHWRDESHVMFLSDRDGMRDVWEIEVDPRTGAKVGEPVRVTSGLDAVAFAVSSEGRALLAVKEKNFSTLWTFPTEPAQIDSLSAGMPLTTGDFRDARPRWSADGGTVFFESNRRGSINVWTVPVAGGTPARLTSGVGLESRPRPSPDSQWVAFDKDGNWTWLMRPDGSSAHAPADWARFANVCCAGWSPDGRRVLLTLRVKNGASRLGFADVASETGAFLRFREADMPGNLEEYARWSPDGRGFAFESFSKGSFDIWIADADGNGARRVTDPPGNERSAVWQATPLLLYFWVDDGAIWRVPMTDIMTPAGTPARWLAIPGLRALVDSLDLSRDGKRAVIALSRPESDVWIVERK